MRRFASLVCSDFFMGSCVNLEGGWQETLPVAIPNQGQNGLPHLFCQRTVKTSLHLGHTATRNCDALRSMPSYLEAACQVFFVRPSFRHCSQTKWLSSTFVPSVLHMAVRKRFVAVLDLVGHGESFVCEDQSAIFFRGLGKGQPRSLPPASLRNFLTRRFSQAAVSAGFAQCHSFGPAVFYIVVSSPLEWPFFVCVIDYHVVLDRNPKRLPNPLAHVGCGRCGRPCHDREFLMGPEVSPFHFGWRDDFLFVRLTEQILNLGGCRHTLLDLADLR